MNLSPSCFFFFFFNDTATTEIYTLSLHDALPISALADGDGGGGLHRHRGRGAPARVRLQAQRAAHGRRGDEDRKSTRLNSSHDQISYAVFCLKKKKECQRSR